MTVTLDLPAEAQARLQAEATRRGITLDQLIAEIAGSFPAEPADNDGERAAPRRKLAFVGIGASKAGITHQIDELLSEEFGRS